MQTIWVMVKPASGSCNLRCRYCFYADVAKNRVSANHGVMHEETAKLLAERIAEAVNYSGNAYVSFQGGEPMMAGLAWFQRFATLMDAYPSMTVHWSLQTNATLLNDAWAEFLSERKFLVGVSLDGPRSLTDFMRFNPGMGDAYDRVLNGILQLRKANVEFNVLTVVTRQLAQMPKQLMQFYLHHDLTDVQLIPCLPILDGGDDGFSLRPDDYRYFFLAFFQEWRRAAEQGRMVRINLFDNVLGMLMGHPPYQCGMLGRCAVQNVIEANGDVYPCDFYCLDEYRLGNLADMSLRDMSSIASARRFLDEGSCRREPCATCPYARICNGGCRRQNVCYLTDERCAYQDALTEIVPALAHMYGLQ